MPGAARLRRRSIQYKGSYLESVLADGALAYWPLGEGVTDTDHSGNGHDLTWSGTTPTSAQMLGFAGGATMAEDALGRNPAATTDSWPNAVRTIEAWVEFTSTSTLAIVSLRNTAEHYALYHDNTDGVRLVVGRLSGFNTMEGNTGGVLVNDGSIHHVMASWSFAEYSIFVDGTTIASAPWANPPYSQSTTDTYITVGSEVGPTRRWDGGLAHVAVYSDTLTLVEAAVHNTLGRL